MVSVLVATCYTANRFKLSFEAEATSVASVVLDLAQCLGFVTFR